MKRIGTQVRLSENERTRLIGDLNFWRNKSDEYYANREKLEDAFYCFWNDQSLSGLVLDSDDAAAWPFNGASDQRVRLADKMFQKFYALIAVALSAATIEITTSGADREKRSQSLLVLLRWMLDNLGSEGWAQIRAVIHYFLVDSPAIAALAVDWKKIFTLHPEESDAEEIVGEFASAMANQGMMSEVEAQDLGWSIITGGQSADGSAPDPTPLIDFLVTSKSVRRKDAAKIVRALGEGDGTVEFLVRGRAEEGIDLSALRYGDDFCIPVAAESFVYANPWFRGEWLTEEQLRVKIESDGWDEKWVEETLTHPGADFYNSKSVEAGHDEDYKDLYNVCWCYTAETNDYGETVRYVTVLGHAEGSAFGKRVLSSRRGKWDTVLFRREVLSTNIVEGRGLAEICAPDQGLIKQICDRENDAAIIGSLPPIVEKGSQAKKSVFQPFGRIPIGSSDEIKFMAPPQFPATAKDRVKEIKDELFDYLGISNGQTNVSERVKATVQDILLQFKDLFVTMIEVAQENATDELLAGVTDDGDVKGLKREDITGVFGVKLVLDPDNLDGEKLVKKLTTFSQILGMDKRGEVDTSPVLRHALTALFPEVSKRSIKSAAQLRSDDLADEQENFVKIKSGVMPQMNTEGGWNYGARLQFWSDLQGTNPEAIETMSPKSQEMMQQWLEALKQQQTQFEQNAQIGKTGVEGVTAR